MVDIGYFEKKNLAVKYPEKVSKPRLSSKASPKEIRDYADTVEKYLITKEQYDKSFAAFVMNRKLVAEEFKQSVLDDLKISNHPKRDKIYSVGYERSAKCYESIYEEVSKLVDLISYEVTQII